MLDESRFARRAGITTASLGIGAVVFSRIAGRLTDRFDPRLRVTVGFMLFAVTPVRPGSRR